MIQANDLRIGNYYDHNGAFRKATPETILEVWEAERTWCKPIPITEEILLKCGFDEDEVVKCLYHLKIGNIIISITIEGSDVLDVTFANTNITGVSIDTESCLYLHGLQNITHALTNTELNITL